jgi:hypothetical protein
MNDKPASDILTYDHLARFGSIICSFAHLEYLMQAIMAAMAGVDDTKIMVLTKSLTYSQKRDTLYSYFNLYNSPIEHQTNLKKLLDTAHNHNGLRNHIAHSLWKKGIRPNTIRPGYIDVRQGKGKIVGYDDDEKDYTVDELSDAANELRRTLNALIRYLRDSGISPDIARKIELISPDI